jgi:hypothetical protein
MSTAHGDIQDFLGAYALDAVERSDAELIERHLEVCPRCRIEVQEHREVAGLLGYAGKEAPAGLWDRIAATMQEAPPALRLERVPAPAAGFTVLADGGESAQTGAAPSVASAPRHGHGGRAARRSGHRLTSVRVRTVAVLAAAAAVVVGVLGVQVLRLDHRTSTLQSAVGVDVPSGPTMAVVDAALRTPGARKVVLAPLSSGQSVRAVLLPDGQGYLYDARLAPLSSAQTYQLWGITGSQAVSYGLIGNAPPTVVSFRTGPGLTALAVTAEVAGGVVQTVHAPVAAGAVAPPL